MIDAIKRSGSTEYENGRVSLQVLSHSRTAVERDCPAKYGYRYPDGLRPRAEKDPTRIRGRGMHEGLRAGFEVWRDLKNGCQGPDLPTVAAVPQIRCAALTACFDAHSEALEELERARLAGASVETVDAVLESLQDGYDADSWAVGHFFEVIAARDYERKTPILIEHAFDVPVLDAAGSARHLRWIGYFDCVMYDSRTKVLELWEAKSVGTNAGSDEHRRRIEGDPQTTSYVHALRHLQKTGQLDEALLGAGLLEERARRVPVGAVVVHVIRRKRPAEPKTLANGTVSTDSRIDTLPVFYEKALEGQQRPPALVEAEKAEREASSALSAAYGAGDVDLTAKDIAKLEKAADRTMGSAEKKRQSFEATKLKQRQLLEQLERRGDPFLSEVEHFVTEQEVERWRGEQWIAAARMRRIEQRPAERTRNLSFCTSPGRGCTYRTLCYSGGDPMIAAREFTTPEEREKMVAAEAEEEEVGQEPAPYAAPAWG